jgi:hypothetical protein
MYNPISSKPYPTMDWFITQPILAPLTDNIKLTYLLDQDAFISLLLFLQSYS